MGYFESTILLLRHCRGQRARTVEPNTTAAFCRRRNGGTIIGEFRAGGATYRKDVQSNGNRKCFQKVFFALMVFGLVIETSLHQAVKVLCAGDGIGHGVLPVDDDWY